MFFDASVTYSYKHRMVCLKIENFTNSKRTNANVNQAMLDHRLNQNDLNAFLNGHRVDTPVGKAYRVCSDGICYSDNRK